MGTYDITLHLDADQVRVINEIRQKRAEKAQIEFEKLSFEWTVYAMFASGLCRSALEEGVISNDV